jgi:hypothetical protein
MDVLDRFDEVFEIEMDGWCYGVEQYPGEIFPGLIHAVIRELGPSFKAAFEHLYVFNILELSEKFAKAAKYLVHEKEITFSILAQFPNPAVLDEDGQFAMAQVIDQVEQHYGGALNRLMRKWNSENKRKQAA